MTRTVATRVSPKAHESPNGTTKKEARRNVFGCFERNLHGSRCEYPDQVPGIDRVSNAMLLGTLFQLDYHPYRFKLALEKAIYRWEHWHRLVNVIFQSPFSFWSITNNIQFC